MIRVDFLLNEARKAVEQKGDAINLKKNVNKVSVKM